MNSLQQRLSSDVSLIIFNVKGTDLLAIDEIAPDLSDTTRMEWQKCGLKPEPFSNVMYMYPYADQPKSGYTRSHVDQKRLADQQQKGKAFNYFYDIETARPKLALLFSDIDDPNSTLESIAHELEDNRASSWQAFREDVEEKTKKGSSKNQTISVMSWRRFSRLLETRTETDLFSERAVTNAELRRQKTIRDAIRDLTPGQVLVIDLEPLPDYLQCLVFGDVIQTIYRARLGDEEDFDPDSLRKVVIFADELNKYAPKGLEDSRRTLTRNLLEVTERGRSLGVVLFGAEQFRSGVHDRILGNCSTNVYGRTSPVEIAKCPDYRYFPESHKATIMRLPQGSLLLQHAVFKTALVRVRFPFPCYNQPKVK